MIGGARADPRAEPAGESGLAGIDTVAFGVLVCVGVTLAVLHGWAVVDAASTARAAASEAARVAAATFADPDRQARITAAAEAVARGLGNTGQVEVEVLADGATPRCAELRVVVHLEVASPLRSSSARSTATAFRLVEPFRDGLDVDHERPPCE